MTNLPAKLKELLALFLRLDLWDNSPLFVGESAP